MGAPEKGPHCLQHPTPPRIAPRAEPAQLSTSQGLCLNGGGGPEVAASHLLPKTSTSSGRIDGPALLYLEVKSNNWAPFLPPAPLPCPPSLTLCIIPLPTHPHLCRKSKEFGDALLPACWALRVSSCAVLDFLKKSTLSLDKVRLELFLPGKLLHLLQR